eukprot:3057067-Rhodomonas_salina.9
MVHEAHETDSLEVPTPSMVPTLSMMMSGPETRGCASNQVTSFESVFSAMGRIPFLGSSFNEVLPPLMGLTFFLALSNALCQNVSCRLPRLDGEAHKTEAIIQVRTPSFPATQPIPSPSARNLFPCNATCSLPLHALHFQRNR